MISIVRSELTKALTLPSVWIIMVILTAVDLLFQLVCRLLLEKKK